MTLLFANTWIWLICVIAGLLLIVTELVVGVDTGLDFVFIGSSFVVGGLITWPLHNWIISIIVVSVICIAYVVLGRSKIKNALNGKLEITNADAIIGMKGVVTEDIKAGDYGTVKVRGEVWRATSNTDIVAGKEIEVESLAGVTLTVKE